MSKRKVESQIKGVKSITTEGRGISFTSTFELEKVLKENESGEQVFVTSDAALDLMFSGLLAVGGTENYMIERAKYYQDFLQRKGLDSEPNIHILKSGEKTFKLPSELSEIRETHTLVSYLVQQKGIERNSLEWFAANFILKSYEAFNTKTDLLSKLSSAYEKGSYDKLFRIYKRGLSSLLESACQMGSSDELFKIYSKETKAQQTKAKNPRNSTELNDIYERLKGRKSRNKAIKPQELWQQFIVLLNDSRRYIDDVKECQKNPHNVKTKSVTFHLYKQHSTNPILKEVKYESFAKKMRKSTP